MIYYFPSYKFPSDGRTYSENASYLSSKVFSCVLRHEIYDKPWACGKENIYYLLKKEIPSWGFSFSAKNIFEITNTEIE